MCVCVRDTDGQRQIQKERDRKKDRGRETDRDRDTERGRQTGRQRHTETERDIDRQRWGRGPACVFMYACGMCLRLWVCGVFLCVSSGCLFIISVPLCVAVSVSLCLSVCLSARCFCVHCLALPLPVCTWCDSPPVLCRGHLCRHTGVSPALSSLGWDPLGNLCQVWKKLRRYPWTSSREEEKSGGAQSHSWQKWMK